MDENIIKIINKLPNLIKVVDIEVERLCRLAGKEGMCPSDPCDYCTSMEEMYSLVNNLPPNFGSVDDE